MRSTQGGYLVHPAQTFLSCMTRKFELRISDIVRDVFLSIIVWRDLRYIVSIEFSHISTFSFSATERFSRVLHYSNQ